MLGLDVHAGGTYVDGTLGGATHSLELLRRSSPDGRVLSLDVDRQALERARLTLAEFGSRWKSVEANFRDVARVAREEEMASCDGVLLDLGLSSDQLVDPSKGLSFLENGPLDMRLGPHANKDGLTAADIVNSWSQEDLERVIRTFGEERYARRIADTIVKARKAARIIGTLDLVAVMRQAVPSNYERGRLHPATRTFQALRMVVNDEIQALQDAMAGALEILRPGGRLAVISFHSLEDRVVKQAFRAAPWTPLTKKPQVPSAQEIAFNPRARSAKLRLASKT